MKTFLSSFCVLAAIGLFLPGFSLAAQVPADFVHETIVGGLNEPNSIAMLPDGRFLITEQRNAKVRLIVGNHIAATDPILVVPSVNSIGYERGLQGIAVDPQWPTRPFVYLMHNRTNGYLRIVRYTASGALMDPNGETLTLGSPMILIDDFPDAQHNHNGETLRFGPDGHLYVSAGEDADPCAAQDSTRLKGVILRLRVSGLPATGTGPVARSLLTPESPALSTGDPNAKLVFAYGLRNPWRFHIDPATGTVVLGDVGEATYEELIEIRAGDNHGWPFREGNSVRSQAGCYEPAGSGRYDPPILTVHHSTGAQAILTAGVYRPTGGAATWPTSYHGSVFYSDYVRGFLRRVVKSGSTWSTPAAVPGQPNPTDWAAGLAFPVDFIVGRDGSLWCLSQYDASGSAFTGNLSRIRYTGAPVAGVPDWRGGALALSGSPNPFSTHAEIRFVAPHAAHARLAVFDTRGRRVRTLLDQAIAAGEARIAWDGTDERGAAVVPGIYYLRLEHGSRVETARVLRLR